MVGAAAVTVIGGIFGSNKAAKTQAQAIRLQRDQLNFNKKRYEDYQNQYGSINDLVVNDAIKGVSADLGRASGEANADTATAFQNAQTALDNQNQRMGINPNSGRAEASNRKLALGQAVATAGNVTNARNTERKNASDQTWNRRYSVYGSGLNLVTNAANSMNNSSNNLSNTLSNQAARQQDAANEALGLGASLGIQALQGYKDNNNANKSTITIPTDQIESSTKGLKLFGTDVSSGILQDNISSVQPPNNINNSFLG